MLIKKVTLVNYVVRVVVCLKNGVHVFGNLIMKELVYYIITKIYKFKLSFIHTLKFMKIRCNCLFGKILRL